jgi:hypothetical protein
LSADKRDSSRSSIYLSPRPKLLGTFYLLLLLNHFCSESFSLAVRQLVGSPFVVIFAVALATAAAAAAATFAIGRLHRRRHPPFWLVVQGKLTAPEGTIIEGENQEEALSESRCVTVRTSEVERGSAILFCLPRCS